MDRSILIKTSASTLVVIDVQQRLVSAMRAPARTLKITALLIEATREMDVPVFLTEQYPAGFGRAMMDIATGA